MTKQLRKIFSILCAVALLFSSLATALAEETAPAEEAAAQAVVEETVVEVPAAEEPAVAEPVAEAPVAEEPVVEQPVVEEPAAVEPVVEAPAPEEPVVEEPVVEQPAVEEPAAEEPAAEEPAAQEPAAEEPAAEEPAAEEPAAQEPAAEEPAAEEPAAEEPAAEEPAAQEPAAEEPAAEEPAAEEPAAEEPAAEEPASIKEETEEDSEEDDGLVELDDGWGYIDQEVIDENTPEITDELKGLRSAELTVGEVLTETIDFGEELEITLKDSGASTVDLRLYVPSGASINTKVDGKAVGFTPAESDVPSMDLYTYELANAAGRSHEIVLSSYDTVNFALSATVSQAETVEEPVTEESIPAEVPAGETPAGETPDETPAPTVQVSVKTYDALKVGNSISDTLIAGQKAKIQVKCGKNLNVVLTLNANPDDATVTIEGTEAQFVSAGNGTYTCELTDVPFRKFNVVISAKQELDFTLSAAAGEDAEEVPAEEDDEENEEEVAETEEENAEDINNEETAEEPSEEVTEEPSEEAAEETSEEVTDEKENEEAETPEEENEGEEAADEEENTEEETEEEPEEEAVEAEHLTDEQLIELGYRKVQVLNKNGADIYAGIDDEVIAHVDFESELWIKDAETKGWAEIYTEEEAKQFVKLAELDKQPLTEEEIEALGYRKVQIQNQNGTDIYVAAKEETKVIGHADFESEIWIMDLEEEGWAEVYTEKDARQFVKLAEIEKQPLTDEQMLEMGYYKVMVILEVGNEVYTEPDENSEIIEVLPTGTELWVIPEGEENWARIYSEDEEQPARYINLVDMASLIKPENSPELPIRSIIVTNNTPERGYFFYGEEVVITAETQNFMDNDQYEISWMYSSDQGETFNEIEDAHDLAYRYVMEEANDGNIYKIVITLLPKE